MTNLHRDSAKYRRAVLIGFAALSASQLAHAYAYIQTCSGDPVMKDSGPLDETRNACSLNSNHPPSLDSYFRAITAWNNISPLAVTASWMRDISDCRIEFGDWSNEIALVTRASIGGMNGLTTYNHVNICIGSAGDYGETDTRVANDMNFSVPSETHFLTRDKTTVGAGRMTIVHEIGHQLGLAHANGFNVMNEGNGRPLGGDDASPPTPMADESAGLNSIYGGWALTNLVASAQAWVGSGMVSDNRATAQTIMCKSQLLNVFFTVVNQGNLKITFNQRIFLSLDSVPNPSPSRSFTIANWVGGWVNPRASGSWNVNFGIPASIPAGTYFLFHRIDYDSAITENNENDNTVIQRSSIVLQNC